MKHVIVIVSNSLVIVVVYAFICDSYHMRCFSDVIVIVTNSFVIHSHEIFITGDIYHMRYMSHVIFIRCDIHHKRYSSHVVVITCGIYHMHFL